MTIHTTSLELSKKLKEAGCEVESKYGWFKDKDGYFLDKLKKEKLSPSRNMNEPFRVYPAYNILWDICMIHKNKFFNAGGGDDVRVITDTILKYIQQNKMKEA